MKKLFSVAAAGLVAAAVFFSCEKSPDGGNPEPDGKIETVTNLEVLPWEEERGIHISWTNPVSPDIEYIEVAFRIKDLAEWSDDPSPDPTLISGFERGGSGALQPIMPTYDMNIITVTSIDKKGNRSEGISVEARPFKAAGNSPNTSLLEQADLMMGSMMDLMLGGSRNLWANYPRQTDQGVSLWGQGAGFSAFAAMRIAAKGTALEKKYGDLEDTMFDGLENYLHVIDGVEAYTVYPGKDNDRYYDDNVWIGLEMLDLFSLTGRTRYLDRAVTVWNYLLKGTDDTAGGGIHWRERPATQSKHACSTAPGIVLAAKLYLATGKAHYLESAEKLYDWMVATLQDPSNHLVWDNAREDATAEGGIKIDKNKYAYNSGQLLQGAALLYEITAEQKYLDNARNIAASSFAKWFVPYYWDSRGSTVTMLSGGGDNKLWMRAVMSRGFFELDRVDPAPNSAYMEGLLNTVSVIWESRNTENNFVANDLRSPQSGESISFMDTAAVVEIFGRAAKYALDNQ